jgi:hypothetical protein
MLKLYNGKNRKRSSHKPNGNTETVLHFIGRKATELNFRREFWMRDLISLPEAHTRKKEFIRLLRKFNKITFFTPHWIYSTKWTVTFSQYKVSWFIIKPLWEGMVFIAKKMHVTKRSIWPGNLISDENLKNQHEYQGHDQGKIINVNKETLIQHRKRHSRELKSHLLN